MRVCPGNFPAGSSYHLVHERRCPDRRPSRPASQSARWGCLTHAPPRQQVSQARRSAPTRRLRLRAHRILHRRLAARQGRGHARAVGRGARVSQVERRAGDAPRERSARPWRGARRRHGCRERRPRHRPAARRRGRPRDRPHAGARLARRPDRRRAARDRRDETPLRRRREGSRRRHRRRPRGVVHRVRRVARQGGGVQPGRTPARWLAHRVRGRPRDRHGPSDDPPRAGAPADARGRRDPAGASRVDRATGQTVAVSPWIALPLAAVAMAWSAGTRAGWPGPTCRAAGVASGSRTRG